MARPKKTSRLTPKGTRPEGFVTEESLSGDMPKPSLVRMVDSQLFVGGVAVIFSNYMSWCQVAHQVHGSLEGWASC